MDTHLKTEAESLAARFKSINRAAFAREHNVPGGPAMIYQHIKGLRPISLEAAKAYATGFGVTLAEISPRLAREVLEASKLNPSGEQITTWENERDMPPDDNRVWVDRWDYAFSAGDGGIQWEVRQKAALPFNAGFFAAIGSDAKDCRLLMVKGDSMEPFLFDRDMIMVDVTKTSIRDGRIYAVHFEGEAFIKQVFKQAAGALSLHSLNARYPDRLVELEDMGSLIIVGEVVYRSGSGFI